VAGAGYFDYVAVGAGGVPTFEVWVDGPVVSGDDHPGWFGSPGGVGDGCFEVVGEVEDLRSRHEFSLVRGNVSCEILMKLCGVEIGETVCGLLDHCRFAQVAGDALSVVGFILSGVRHVRCDVDEGGDGRVGAGFGDDGATVAVADEDGGAVLQVDDAFGGGYIFFEGRFGFLDDGDVIAVFDEDVVDAAPAGAIGPGAVNENYISDAVGFGLR